MTCAVDFGDVILERPKITTSRKKSDNMYIQVILEPCNISKPLNSC